MTQRRHETTGAHHSFQPGRFTLAARAVFQRLAPSSMRKSIAVKLQKGMEEVESLEKQQMWLRTHGSPLAVMGLPDHAELQEVRCRYRDLILETHPDTQQSGVSGALVVDRSDYHILQAAYKMATSPDSLWHRNQSAPQLYEELVSSRPFLQRCQNRITLFAVLSYALMLFVGTVIAHAVFKELCEKALAWADPEFFEFMVAQEKEEQRKRDAGEFLDTDPKRLAPTAIRRLAYPGRFVHGDEETPEKVFLRQQQSSIASGGAAPIRSA